MIIIFIVIALITMISIVITIMFGTTATTMSSITTSFWGSQDRSVLLALLFNPRVAMTHANENHHGRRRRCESTYERRKKHLLELLQYAVCNMATLHAEEGRTTLRDIASALHCSNAGVRLRYEADYGTDGVVGAFQELTAWNDLLTAEQRSRGDHLYQLYSAYADERASGGTGGGALDPGLHQILATLVDLRDSVSMVPVWEQLPRLGRERYLMEIQRSGTSTQGTYMV